VGQGKIFVGNANIGTNVSNIDMGINLKSI